MFRWFALNATLQAGESVATPIRFTPTRVGTAPAEVDVFVSGSAPLEVDLNARVMFGAPLIRVEPPGPLLLGQVLVGRSATREVRSISLSDNEPVTVGIDASQSGAPIRWSAVAAQIPPAGSRSVPVTFRRSSSAA